MPQQKNHPNLRSGGQGGNQGGRGQIPTTVREACRLGFAESVPDLCQIAKNIPGKIADELADDICAAFGLKGDQRSKLLELLRKEWIQQKGRPFPVNEQLKSIDTLGKYGLGELQAVVLEEGDWLPEIYAITARHIADAGKYNEWRDEVRAFVISKK